MTSEEQLTEWVKGNSIHNTDRDECCPDFSCCNPDVNTPKEERELFMELHDNKDEPEKMRMLGMFLGRAFATLNLSKNIHIGGMID